MLALFAMALLTAIGLGWYLGWYKVRSQPASVPGQHSVQIDFDTKKIEADLQNSEQKIKQIIKDKTKDETKSSDALKTSGNLMLPSPQLNTQTDEGTSVQMHGDGKGPLFEIHRENGSSLQIGNGENGPLIQFRAGDKK
jgi:hypothetical protein